MVRAKHYLKISCVVVTLAACCACATKDPVASDASGGLLATATPAAHGLDAARLTALKQRINAGNYGDIRSLLIIRDDHLVYEEYFQGSNREELQNVYSVTKSITSAALGTALYHNEHFDLEKNLLNLFQEYDEFEYDGRLKHEITLRNVLNMSAGFRWDEWSMAYGHPQNDATMLSRSNDWIKHVLDLSMAASPGSEFSYNSGCSILLSRVLELATGQSAEAYTAEILFRKLGIDRWRWEKGPNELSNTAWGLFMRPIDMALIGYLFLKEGRWENEQLVPEDWVRTSTAPHISAGFSFDYGYQWWRFSESSPLADVLMANDAYFAWGFGGQFIFVFPHLDMVVVSTAENYDNSAPTFSFLRDYILTSVHQPLSLAE